MWFSRDQNWNNHSIWYIIRIEILGSSHTHTNHEQIRSWWKGEMKNIQTPTSQWRFIYILLATLAVVRLEPMTALIISNFNFLEMKLKSDKVKTEFEPGITDWKSRVLTTTLLGILIQMAKKFKNWSMKQFWSNFW
jgi:hypothetical protein